jgi:acetyl-CoA acetyltransferase
VNLRGVGIIGVGLTAFDKHDDRSAESLGREAVVAAMRDAAIERTDVDLAVAAHLYQGEVFGQRVLRELAFPEITVLNVENACAGGSSAVREAWLAIGTGQCDVAIAIGVEKMGRGLISFVSPDVELALGNTAPAQYALAAQRHMHEFGSTPEMFARIAVKSRAHAARNPHARFRDPVTLDEVLASRPIAEPLTLLQCCRNGSGAAAIVLAAHDWLKSHGRSPTVSVVTSNLASVMADKEQRDLTSFGATRVAAKAAYEAAGIGPDDVDVIELHDAFTAGEFLHYEGLGLCAKGEATRLVMDGETTLGGRCPVNLSGGLLAKSHPLGATGVAQFAELTWQLRGTAENRQVEGARIGLAHSQGGTGLEAGATCVTLLMRQ